MKASTRHQWDFDDVLARTDLRSLLDEVTHSNGKHGSLAKWHCPDPHHADNRPSVTVTADHRGKERWRCWSSNDHRGDAIDLVRTVRGVSNVEAVDWLAGRAGMTPDRPLPPPLPRAPKRIASPSALDPMVERYVAKAEAVLRGSQGRPMREWLNARGINDDTIATNRLGADVGRQLMRRPRGLPYGAGTGVVFPAFDPNGEVSYVQTRYLDPDTAGRKYDNPASRLGTNPRVSFVRPNQSESASGLLLVTEGIPDGLIAAQAGFGAVAIMGSQAPDALSATRVANHANALGATVVLAVDADPAGAQAVALLEGHLADAGASPTTVQLPAGLDLNDWALQEPGWADQIVQAISGPDVDLALDRDELSMEATADMLRSHEVAGREL